MKSMFSVFYDYDYSDSVTPAAILAYEEFSPVEYEQNAVVNHEGILRHGPTCPQEFPTGFL